MKVDLLKYMSERYLKEEHFKHYPGPVITISRECGCPAKKIATRLTELLNSKLELKNKKPLWKWISKEILHESAKELELDPKNIQYVFEYEHKTLVEELLSAHSSKYYKSDRKIRNTVAKVIRSIANEGHSIIVGRGGVAITKDIEKSLHVNLHAPIEWRAIRTSQKQNIDIHKAKTLSVQTDKKRAEFRNYFHGKNTDYTWFDVTYNCMTFTVDEIAESILKIIELRGMLD